MRTYAFTLFVAGKEAVKSREIAVCIKEHLKKHLKDAFTLDVVDVIESPEIALKEQIFVTPSWVCNSPGPKKKVVGNFCIEENVSRGLDIFLK